MFKNAVFGQKWSVCVVKERLDTLESVSNRSFIMSLNHFVQKRPNIVMTRIPHSRVSLRHFSDTFEAHWYLCDKNSHFRSKKWPIWPWNREFLAKNGRFWPQTTLHHTVWFIPFFMWIRLVIICRLPYKYELLVWAEVSWRPSTFSSTILASFHIRNTKKY